MQAAWDQAKGLRGGPAAPGWNELGERIAVATALYGADQMARGTVFLIGGAIIGLGVEGPGAQEQEFIDDFTRALMKKVTKSEFVEPGDLPMVRQVVDWAFAGRDVVSLRDKAGPIPESERRALTVTLALIGDFVDKVDGAGACERGLLKAIGFSLD